MTRLLLVLAAFSIEMRGQAAFGRPPILKDVGLEQRLGAQLPLDLEFRDDRDRAVTLRQYTGRPMVFALVYYKCPSLCDLVLNGMVRSLKGLKFSAGRDFEVVAISFDPTEKAALAGEKRATYMKAYGRGDARFHFLTGSAAAIQQLVEVVGFRYTFDPASQQFAHPSALMIATPEGKLSRYFYGVEYPARDVKLGLIDASGGKIGSPIDQLQLFCFHYDASAGKYGLLIMNVLRLGGVLTLVLLAGGIVIMSRRERVHA